MPQISPDVQAVVQRKLEERARAKTDKMFLANAILGYDFQPCHEELFALYPDFDETKSWDEQNPNKDIMVLWPRGHYKSTAIKVVIIQAILNNPDIAILLMQGSVAVTELFLKEITSHFLGAAQDSRLMELFPEFCGTKGELASTAFKFTVPCRKRTQTPQATCTVASPKSIKTGQHYDLGVFDDLQNESNSNSPKLLARVQTEFQGYQPLIQHGSRWVSGTRWAHGDLYEQIIRWDKNQTWTISIKDCWSDDREGVRFPAFIKRNGQKDGFTREALLYLEEQDPAFFACQYLNQPVHAGSQIFTQETMTASLICEKDLPPLSQGVMFVDLAAASSTSSHSDDCVILIGKTDSLSQFYVTDIRGGPWQTEEFALHLIDMAMKHRPLRIMFEKSPTCNAFVAYLRLLCANKNILLPIDFMKVSNIKDAKHIRISALAGHFRTKRLRFLVGLASWGKLVEQFVEFPKARYGHDDYPDTVALMAQTFSEAMPSQALHATEHPLFQMIRLQQQQQASMFTATERPADNDLGDGFAS